MVKTYDLTEGDSPLIISIPHAGTMVPDDIAARFTDIAKELPDTDWHVDRLYQDFIDAHDVTTIKALYSRYVIDLNRPPDDAPLYPGQVKMSLCPERSFDGQPLYQDGQKPNDQEIMQRRAAYWQPYHDELRQQIDRVVAKHGYALLYDAHSIRGAVPALFTGTLPALNLGNARGKSCHRALAKQAFAATCSGNYNAVLNGRFVGGFITRHYGRPDQNVHALQMELAARSYMDEDSRAYDEKKAAKLKPVLEKVLHSALDWAKAEYSPPRAAPAQGLKPNR